MRLSGKAAFRSGVLKGLKGNEESLILRNKGIDDNALKLLSKVKLINLKEKSNTNLDDEDKNVFKEKLNISKEN